MKKIVKCFVLILMIVLFFNLNFSYAGMADWTDDEADKKANEQLQEQQKKDEENLGKSSNNYLSDLSVDGYVLTPSFDKQTINYTIEKIVDDDTINIKAVLDDNRAKVSGDGKVTLQTGENNVKINVTAENGRMRTYFIKVTKREGKNSLKLQKLSLKSVNSKNEKTELELDPEFSQNVYYYSTSVENDVNSIDINYETQDLSTKVVIDGNKSLKDGDNSVTLTLTSNNGEEKTVYKINVYKKGTTQEVSAYSSNKINMDNKTIISIIVIIALLVLIYFLTNKKSKKKKRH